MGETDSLRRTPACIGRGRGELDLRNRDLRTVLKLLEAAVSYYIPGVDPFDHRFAPVGPTRLDCPHRGFVVLDEVDKILASIVLDGRRRDDDLVLKRRHQQTRIHKLVWKQLAVAVIELRAQLDRSRGGV